MRDAVIVEAVRTPVGKRNGGLAGIHSADLSALVLQAIVERTGIDPALVDDVIWGCVMQVGEQTFHNLFLLRQEIAPGFLFQHSQDVDPVLAEFQIDFALAGDRMLHHAQRRGGV